MGQLVDIEIVRIGGDGLLVALLGLGLVHTIAVQLHAQRARNAVTRPFLGVHLQFAQGVPVVANIRKDHGLLQRFARQSLGP